MTRILRFTANWCAPCKAYTPIFNKVASQYPNVQFSTIDIDSNPEIARKYNIRHVPTTLIIDTINDPLGQNAIRRTGVLSEQELINLAR